MNKQELQNEINKTKEHLANMEKMLGECEYERWKPKDNEKFWYIDGSGSVNYSCFMSGIEGDVIRFKNYNCFKTKEEAKTEAEKILVRRQLEDIARRLNKGEKIDYKDNTQCKFCLVYNIVQDRIDIDSDYNRVMVGAVHCLSLNFYYVAIQEIGEERLKKYLRGE